MHWGQTSWLGEGSCRDLIPTPLQSLLLPSPAGLGVPGGSSSGNVLRVVLGVSNCEEAFQLKRELKANRRPSVTPRGRLLGLGELGVAGLGGVSLDKAQELQH